MPKETQQLQTDEIVPIQTVWQILGQKEWQLQMAAAQSAQAQQEVATLRQRLTEALAELTTIQERHATTLLELVALQECIEAKKLMGSSTEEIIEESEPEGQHD